MSDDEHPGLVAARRIAAESAAKDATNGNHVDDEILNVKAQVVAEREGWYHQGDPGPGEPPDDVGDHHAGEYGAELPDVEDVADVIVNADAETYPGPDDPMGVARKLQKLRFKVDGERTLLNWSGAWMQWRQSHWAEAETASVRGELYRELDNAVCVRMVKVKTKDGYVDVAELVAWRPNRRKIGDVLEALQAVTHLGERVTAPSWIGDTYAHGNIVSCTNGLLIVETRELLPHTPRYFNRVAVPYPYDADAPEPTEWLGFLRSLWPDDADSVAAIQEWFGYIVSGRTDLQKMLLMVGPTRSGKGTIARVLTAMVGNATAPTLSSLATNFGLAPLIGSPLAVVSDARLGGHGTEQVVERLLSISGEDMLTIDRKYREPWSGKLPTRFMILTNELPRFGDASGAVAGRFVILQTNTSFLDNEDTELTDRLRTELPGILRWSLVGLDRLVKRGKFTIPDSSRAATQLLRDLVSPVSAFVRDECVTGPAFIVERGELYSAWKKWCEDNGHRVTSSATFGRDLRSVVPMLGATRPGSGSARKLFHSGIGLRGEDDT